MNCIQGIIFLDELLGIKLITRGVSYVWGHIYRMKNKSLLKYLTCIQLNKRHLLILVSCIFEYPPIPQGMIIMMRVGDINYNSMCSPNKSNGPLPMLSIGMVPV